MPESSSPVRKNNWVNIIFFTVTTLVGVIGTPIYIANNGISASEIALFVFFVSASALGITVGYHRLFAHLTFKTNRVIRFLMLFFGAATFEQSALEWASQHRDHHRYVDTDQDPYNIKKGFWYAHIGWLVFWKHNTNYDNVQDMQKDPLVMHQYRHYIAWAVTAGVLTPLLLGLLTDHLLGALLLSVCLRLTVVYHSTFFINSICHMFGTATYDVKATAKDNFLIAFLTFGEGFHNFHHRFPGDYRNGVRWYHWDPSKWLIAMLERLGLATGVKRVSHFRILSARIAGENKRISEWLSDLAPGAELAAMRESAGFRYETLKKNLSSWEKAAVEYTESIDRQMAQYSTELMRAARKNLVEARRSFKCARHDWNTLLASCSLPA